MLHASFVSYSVSEHEADKDILNTFTGKIPVYWALTAALIWANLGVSVLRMTIIITQEEQLSVAALTAWRQ